jgi:hypothetical protein
MNGHNWHVFEVILSSKDLEERIFIDKMDLNPLRTGEMGHKVDNSYIE